MIDHSELEALGLGDLQCFTGWDNQPDYLKDNETKHNRKRVSLEDAIKACGLEDGDTISFHHHFREGDAVIMQVISLLSKMGYRDLTLASSSLNNVHSGLIDYIRNGTITQIYTSGMRGELARQISRGGLLTKPLQIHSHGGRAALLRSGELHPKIAFLGVGQCDAFGNANGTSGRARCGSLGYAMTDSQEAEHVVMLTEEVVDFPLTPASIRQDRVDFVVEVDTVGDPARISTGATRTTRDPRDLLIARRAAEVMVHGGYFTEGFSMQTGSGGASIATIRYLADQMEKDGIKASWGLGGIHAGMVDLLNRGLVGHLLDVQSFDSTAAESLATSNRHHEISAGEYASPVGKAAVVDRLDMVILSALEMDLDFNVNVLTGVDGAMMGASGGHCDTAAGAKMVIVTAPLIRTRIPTVVPKVSTLITPGENIDCLVTDYGIAVNPRNPELETRLRDAKLPVKSIEELHAIATTICGTPKPSPRGDEVVGVVRYRDGSVIDLVRNVPGL